MPNATMQTLRENYFGVVFGVTHFKHFTFGNDIHVITDHKPLVSLLKKSLVACSSRLSRLMLQIVDFSLKILYQPGRKMVISDALSHLALTRPQIQKKWYLV